MPRTIVITLAPPTSDRDRTSEYWSVTEDGRICDGLCWDEMLGAVARITLSERDRYSLKTLDEHKEAALDNRRHHDPMHKRLRDIVAAFDAAGLTGPTPHVDSALAAARQAIAEVDDDHVPF
jgi:hypothetical protein